MIKRTDKIDIIESSPGESDSLFKQRVNNTVRDRNSQGYGLEQMQLVAQNNWKLVAMLHFIKYEDLEEMTIWSEV